MVLCSGSSVYFCRMNASTDFQMICQNEILSVFEFFTEIANHFPNKLYGQLSWFVAIFYLVFSSPFQMIVTSQLHKVHAHFIKMVIFPPLLLSFIHYCHFAPFITHILLSMLIHIFLFTPHSWVWAEAGAQPHLEEAFGIGGFGYPVSI